MTAPGSPVARCPVLREGPVESLAEVVSRLTEIRDSVAAVAPESGVARFSDLYLTITSRIQEHVRTGGFFADNAYLARLDVVFANRYFDALRAWAAGDGGPRCWRLLFDLPGGHEITAAQLAAGGVNAHINLDLAVAVVDTGRELGDAALAAPHRHDDYTKVNDIFAEEMDTLLDRFVDAPADGRRPAGPADGADHPLLGRLATAVVAVARRHAWEDAEALWPLGRHSEAWMVREAHMDAIACWFGRRLLTDLPG
ncbi:MAG TPA: DUF5995 family protein [Acidimicrobiia bacterium]|nr:DUF5995 family protein [Acidimicrobiia bacterium]